MSISVPKSASHADGSTSLYLYFDKYGVLIYVGITSRGIGRNREHNADKVWWQYVSRQEIKHYPSRAVALSAERDLIVRLRPPFNKQHNPEHEALAATYQRLVSQHIRGFRPDKKRSTAHVRMQPGTYDGLVLRCRSRDADVALATAIDLTATPFDTFKAAGGQIGHVVSLHREQFGFEMSLKGRWLGPLTGVSVVVERRGDTCMIRNLQLMFGDIAEFAKPTGITDRQRANIGKFSNGAQLGGAQ